MLASGGVLDAIVYHLRYGNRVVGRQSFRVERGLVVDMQREVTDVRIEDEGTALQVAHRVDEVHLAKIWDGMRRISVLLNNEPSAEWEIPEFGQWENDSSSLVGFSHSNLDLTMCWKKACSIWTPYAYYDTDLVSRYEDSRFGSITPAHSAMCAFVSNCYGYDAYSRLRFIRQLSRYAPIRNYGRCDRNVDKDSGKMYELTHNCKFYLAFENSQIEDYVTEKFFQIFQTIIHGGTFLTIYRGAPNIDSFGIPKDAFINANDFSSVHELGMYLKELNENQDKFLARFKQSTSLQTRTKLTQAISKLHSQNVLNSPCRLCTAVAEMKLSRYLLYKIGLKPTTTKINVKQWIAFKNESGLTKWMDEDRLKILDDIYDRAYGRLFRKDNDKTEWNDSTYVLK